ncbi:MAG: AMP-binding protein [Bacteroidia bacterium]|nr:AMP-binding protein [Bacteroidia bacterium]
MPAVTATASQTQLKPTLDMMYHWEKHSPGKTYLTQPIEGQTLTWTWQEFGQEVRKMAAWLKAQGLEPGSRIGILSRNCAHWIMSDLAIMMSGHISVPIYPNVNAETIAYILDHSDVKVLFVGKLEAHDWTEMKKGIPATVTCVSYGIYDLAETRFPTWAEATASVAPMAENPSRHLDETMTIIYTSGTTGVPKGVVLTFLNTAFAAEELVSLLFKLNENDRFFSYLPLSHIAERMLVLVGTMRCGGSIHFARSLDTFAENLRDCKPTVFLGVPRIWTKFQSGVLAKFSPSRLSLLLSIPVIGGVIRKKIKEALGLDQARVCLTGAAPISANLLTWFKRIGIDIYEVYGMTENSAYSHSNLPGAARVGTVGRALSQAEVKITSEGEICVKSLATMKEYYREPEKTAEALRDGWLHTGDKGVMDADGFLTITGRVKDMFKTSKAKYVAPNPIELKLAKNEIIEQVCVVGSGLPQPLALVVLSPDARKRSREEVAASLKTTLTEVNPTLEDHEKLQNIIVIQDEWTVENGVLTPSLKIKRGVVDDRFTRHYETWYAAGRQTVIWEK